MNYTLLFPFARLSKIGLHILNPGGLLLRERKYGTPIHLEDMVLRADYVSNKGFLG